MARKRRAPTTTATTGGTPQAEANSPQVTKTEATAPMPASEQAEAAEPDPKQPISPTTPPAAREDKPAERVSPESKTSQPATFSLPTTIIRKLDSVEKALAKPSPAEPPRTAESQPARLTAEPAKQPAAAAPVTPTSPTPTKPAESLTPKRDVAPEPPPPGQLAKSSASTEIQPASSSPLAPSGLSHTFSAAATPRPEIEAKQSQLPVAKTESAKRPEVPPALEPLKPIAPSKPVTEPFPPKPAPTSDSITPPKPVLTAAPATGVSGLKSAALPTPKSSPLKTAPPAQTVQITPAQKPATPVPPPAETKSTPLSEEQILLELPKLLPSREPAKAEVARRSEPPPAPSHPSMFVVMISPELAPVAKVGGLGDVVYGLASELELRGNAVEIILPKYSHMRYDHVWGLCKTYENLWVPWYGGAINTTVWFGFVHGRKCFFIEPHSNDKFFERGNYYGNNDDLMRFAFFSRAALEFMHKTGKQPDIIHCHDWQTALVPVLLFEMYQHLGMRHPRACFTIHNFRHQGVTGAQVLQATGLNRPEHFFHYDRMRDNNNPHALNLMKAGIVYSNFVTTVSPRHAWEAKDGGQAHGLEPTLHTHHYKYGGVLNGLDYDQFNPQKDPHIPSPYTAETIEEKYENKRALRQRFWLADNEKPIVAFIGRLDAQKGLELVRHSIFYALNHRAQFVLLGNSPERGINDHFSGLKHHLNDSPDCHLEIGYNEELAHLIYAGADLMVVPSRYEPCGLTQLISLRYGTVPVVRAVGGLADTVFDKDYSDRPLHQRNGYVFDHADNAGLESALHRALGCYYEFPEHWRHLMVNGMNSDYSWNQPGKHYLDIYDFIRDK